ncbi:hypothetical protein ACFVFI_08665 [Streptomyces sp. NPDC057705]|uniref:hypothetical protein n=1 Tax=Streptomyces sp. NPDC057705 TaxID=3346222 RepID=UPI0036839196
MRGELGPQLLRKVVAHALQDHQFGTWDGGSRGPSATDVAHDVGVAVHHQRGHPQRPQPLGAIARRDDREALALHAQDVVPAVEDAPGPFGRSGRIEREPR